MRTRAFILAASAGALIAGSAAAPVSAAPVPGDRYECPRPLEPSKAEPDGFDTRRLEGKLLPRARRIARRHGCEIRVVERDGEPIPGTADYQPDRINVAVERRRVTRVVGTF
jgi:hypothetical protein